jgi:hypothetical protein
MISYRPNHELETEAVPDDTITDDPPVDEVDPELPNTVLYNAEKGIPLIPPLPGDVCQVLSRQSKSSTQLDHIEYKVSYHKATSEKSLSLIDRASLIEVQMEV